MAPVDFHNLLRARPFQPFRIVCPDGTTYQVNHPELVMVGLGSIIIGYPDPGQPGIYQRFDLVGLRQILRVELASQPIEQA